MLETSFLATPEKCAQALGLAVGWNIARHSACDRERAVVIRRCKAPPTSECLNRSPPIGPEGDNFRDGGQPLGYALVASLLAFSRAAITLRYKEPVKTRLDRDLGFQGDLATSLLLGPFGDVLAGLRR